VSQLIAAHSDKVPASIGEQMAALEQRLRQPLRVVVAGRVKAGKSTLVNALLGQQVAPTDVSECTRVVTWFSYGHPERLEIRMRDGGTMQAQLTEDGMLPVKLPVPIEQIASLHAYLANASLQTMTLIDTPGLGSVHDDFSRSTRDLLAADSSQARRPPTRSSSCSAAPSRPTSSRRCGCSRPTRRGRRRRTPSASLRARISSATARAIHGRSPSSWPGRSRRRFAARSRPSSR
jgi:hypothetical protein